MFASQSIFEILLAEDNAADAALVREALALHDVRCNLHVVIDGEQTLKFLDGLDQGSESRLDLLLLDVHLPKCDGDLVLRRLRATERHSLAPVVVMTGDRSPTLRQSVLQHTAVSYFNKPSNLDEFMELGGIVKNILNEARGAGAS